MFAEVYSGMTIGIQGELISTQVDVSDGLPVFNMIGYLSAEVKEAKERVRTAMKNAGFRIPAKRIAVNLAPADIRKTGNQFDLSIAVGLFLNLGVSDKYAKDTLFLGELALDGSINGVSGVLPIIKHAKEKGFKRCVVPVCNAMEAALIEEIEVYSFVNLNELYSYLVSGDSDHVYISDADDKVRYEEHGLFGSTYHQVPDLSEVKGQELAKRALMISVAGYHNLYLDGPPGVGKSMLASCIPGIMPDMTREEQIDITMIHSVKGLLSHNANLLKVRPFRAPSHSVTMAGMFGGGTNIKPGEISLAHHGVLFLDEFPEYKRDMIDMFRLPLENHQINLVRNERNIIFPADFILVAAANPCPCGYYPDRNRCRCSESQIHNYQNKISGPIMDRIDLYVRCNKVSYEEFYRTEVGGQISNAEVKDKVMKAWKMQKQRFGRPHFNGRMSSREVSMYCRLDSVSAQLMERVYREMDLTGRSYHKILKTARTIADLEDSIEIQLRHIEEALMFRNQIGIKV